MVIRIFEWKEKKNHFFFSKTGMENQKIEQGNIVYNYNIVLQNHFLLIYY